MAERTYVVEKEQDRMGRHNTVYAGQNADKAKEIADDLYVPRDAAGGPLETFIHVWENGEHQFCTREHPE
jgi:hypothetical protein